MVTRHGRRHASGPVRMLVLLVLVLGVAAMHAGIVTIGAGPQIRVEQHTTIAIVPFSHAAHHDAVTGPMSGERRHAHAVTHPCVFVLSASALLIGLVLLPWLGTGPSAGQQLAAGVWRRRRQRSPPWTVPSLAGLSILRI